MDLKGKFYRFRCEELLNKDIFPDFQATLINFDKLENEDKEKIIYSMDFRINKNAIRTNMEENDEEELGKPCWKLEDMQGANLANIESDEFEPNDYDSMLDRLDAYYHDYGCYFLQELKNDNVNFEIIEEIPSSQI